MNMQNQHLAIAKNIRCLACDVDGVLTDGQLYFDAHGENLKAFNVQDGMGLTLLMQAKVHVAIISGRSSKALEMRLQELSIKHTALGQRHKLHSFNELLRSTGLKASQVAYIGDDVNDLCILNRVGLSITVANAPNMIKQQTHCTTTLPGGHGAVREVCDALLDAQGHWKQILQDMA